MTVYEDTMARLVELERENRELSGKILQMSQELSEANKYKEALSSAVEALNHQAEIVSEWSGTGPSLCTVEDFL